MRFLRLSCGSTLGALTPHQVLHFILRVLWVFYHAPLSCILQSSKMRLQRRTMSCLRSQGPSPNHPTLPPLPSCVSTLVLVGLWYVAWAWVFQTAYSPYPSSCPEALSGLEKNNTPSSISSICPSHLQNHGHKGAERCRGLLCTHGRSGEKRVPFSTQVYVQLPASEETVDSNRPASPFPFLASQEELW